MRNPTDYDLFLWLFTVLLFFRVIGQIVVVLFAPRWLPPMEQWQSGLLPYPVLLAGQAVVLTLMVWISADFSRGAGFFLDRGRSRLARPCGSATCTLAGWSSATWSG